MKARDAAVKEIMESFGEENPASLNAHLTTAEEAWGADVIANYVKSHPDAKPDIWDKWAGNSMENNTASWIQEALQEAGTYINGDLVPNNVVNIGNDIRGRAFFHDETNTLFITDTYYSKIVKGSTYHELGHWLEKNIPGAHQAMVDFLDRRTKGEKAKPISVTTRSPKEMFKKDKFFHPYVGKIYQSGDTEVLSMGLEALFKDPYRLAHNDPDMFNTVLSTLKGIPKE